MTLLSVMMAGAVILLGFSIATLKAEVEVLKARVADLENDQP